MSVKTTKFPHSQPLDREADEAAARGDLEDAERLRGLARREADETASLVIATKGETMRYDHLGKVLAARLRMKEGR